MEPAKRPNILFIMTDQQRHDALGKVEPAIKTPILDKLAEESLHFTRAYTVNPSCVPARAAISTGRYPSQIGAPTYTTYVHDTETTFMSLLQQSGYYTAVVGKQHFGESKITRGYNYEDINDIHFANKELTNIRGTSPSYLKFLRDAGFTDPSQLFRPYHPYVREWVADVKYHIDSYIGERGKDWIRTKRPKEQPWFLFLSFPGPHSPYDCINIPHADKYDLQDIKLPIDPAFRADKPPHFHEAVNNTDDMTNEYILLMRKAYYANVSLIDEKIGEVLDELKRTGEYDNTLILFTSDHGDFMGDFGLIHKGQYLSESLMRVPLLLKPPISDAKGRKVDNLVANIDIAATCLSIAGVGIPTSMSSKDLNRFTYKENESSEDESLYMEASDLRAVRTDRWKLIHYRNRTYGELYDLHNDPGETNNRWADSSLDSVKQHLYTIMVNQLIEMGTKSDQAWNVGAPII